MWDASVGFKLGFGLQRLQIKAYNWKKSVKIMKATWVSFFATFLHQILLQGSNWQGQNYIAIRA